MSTKLEESLKSGQHKNLNSLVGNWEGQTKTWFEPGEPIDVATIKGTIKPLFDGRFIQHEYASSFQGAAFEGFAIYGYHIKTGKFQCAWMDTFHMGTGIMFSEGSKAGKFFDVLGGYEASAEDPTLWGWRTEITILDENELLITFYNISPEGQEAKATETAYRRIQ